MLFREIIVDNFAGGGGTSTGIYRATGRHVDVAINHDPAAIAMHRMNHQETRHYCESVWDVDPRQVVQGMPVALCWLSPDCKHFSIAKGGTPVEKAIRGLAWVALRWAATVKPRVIMLENVVEFLTWGPIVDGRPCPRRKGKTFRSFVRALERQGYAVDWRQLRACDFGAPTSRKRLFLVARRDGQPIAWPKPTHGDPASPEVKKGRLLPFRTAADCIDWSLPCPSIFERKRPLAENTMQRIFRGLQKFVLEHPDPFIVPGGAAFVAKHFGGNYNGAGLDLRDPMSTVTTRDHHALITSHLVKLRGTCKHGQPNTDPMPTITAGGNHVGEVRAYLLKYYGTNTGQACREPLQTITTKHRFGLVTVRGELHQIVDIGMRMLEPSELFAGNGFPADYIIDRDEHGNRVSKEKQVARCGNAVPPAFAEALVRANLPELCVDPAREVAA